MRIFSDQLFGGERPRFRLRASQNLKVRTNQLPRGQYIQQHRVGTAAPVLLTPVALEVIIALAVALWAV